MQSSESTSKRGAKETRPWSTMDINDSFFVSSTEVLPSSMRSFAYKKGLDLGRKFSVAKAEGGVTVIRVE